MDASTPPPPSMPSRVSSSQLLMALAMLVRSFVESWVFGTAGALCRWLRFGGRSTASGGEELQVVHDGPHFLVVDKPYDLIINHSDPSRESVAGKLRLQFPALYDPSLEFGFRFAHRLDFATSGALLIAKTRSAAAVAQKAFAQRRVKKFYLGLARGHFSSDFIHVRLAVGDHCDPAWRGIRMATAVDGPAICLKPRPAETKIVVLSRGLFNGSPATEVLLGPATGRRHQLRLHCHYLGHTLVGDYTYSNRRDFAPFRMFLHSLRLVLEDDDLIDKVHATTCPGSFSLKSPDGRDEYRIVEKVMDLEAAWDVFSSESIRWKMVEPPA